MEQILRKGFDLMETIFLVYHSNGTNITDSFAPQNEPNSAKSSFSSILKHFCQKLTKKLLFKVEILLSQKDAKNYPESYFSSTTL